MAPAKPGNWSFLIFPRFSKEVNRAFVSTHFKPSFSKSFVEMTETPSMPARSLLILSAEKVSSPLAISAGIP